MNFTRRQAVVGALAAGGGAWLNWDILADLRRRACHGACPAAALVEHPRQGMDLGQAYLDLHPQEADLDQLAAALHLQPDQHADVARDSFQSLVKQDFDRGDTVTLRGWVLARSEGRLFALCALYQSR